MSDPIVIEGDVSATPEDLSAKIDAELGLPAKPADETPEAPETPAAEPEAPEEPETPEEPEVEEETPTPEAPAVGTPSDEDLFIEIEDADGTTHKISRIEDLPEDFSPKNNRQILEITTKLMKLDAERETAEATRATAEQAALVKETQTAQIKAWDNEVAELAKDKRIDPKDSERVDAVFKYMAEINDARNKAGNPNLISSFEDALDKFEVREAKDAAALAEKNETDLAKKKSGLIGRGSAAAGSDKYVYVAGSARSIYDIPM